MTKKDCFGYYIGRTGKATCAALKVLDCKGCRFYKPRSQWEAESAARREREEALREAGQKVQPKRCVISDDEKARIIDLYKRGSNIIQIEGYTGISASYGTIRKIIREWKGEKDDG